MERSEFTKEVGTEIGRRSKLLGPDILDWLKSAQGGECINHHIGRLVKYHKPFNKRRAIQTANNIIMDWRNGQM